jgi:hypothetical protein
MAGGTTVSSVTGFPPFSLGGPLVLSALARNQFVGNHYYYNGAYLMRSLSKERLSLLNKFRATIGYELGNAFVSGDPPRPFNDGMIGIVGETGIGVVTIGAAFGEHGEKKIFISIGRFF